MPMMPQALPADWLWRSEVLKSCEGLILPASEATLFTWQLLGQLRFLTRQSKSTV